MRGQTMSLLAALLLGSATAAEPVDPALKGLRERWAEAMKELNIPGVAVVVVRDNRVIHLEALGVRDPDGAKPVTPDTYFYIASCTKPYLAMLAARLAEEGKLDLDAPVKRYLPRFQVADAELTEKLTVRDLLTHRQGLNSFPIVFLDAFTGEITEDRYYHFLKEVKPTKRCEYSNLHFTLAGRVIEAVTGKNWRDALREHLFQPVGMGRTTGYASKMYADEDAAFPLEARDGGWALIANRKTDRTMHAAGGLGTTARDLGRWLRLNLNGGEIDGRQILSRRGIEPMQTLQAKAAGGPRGGDLKSEGFGLGWQIGSCKDIRVVLHGGGYPGAAAHISFLPDKRVGVAVVANTGAAAGPFVSEVAALDVYKRLLGVEGEDILPRLKKQYGEYIARRRKDPAAPNPAEGKGLSLEPEKYAGTYENANWGTARVGVKDGKLTAVLGELAMEIKSNGADRMQFRNAWTERWREARFEVKDGRVVAVIARMEGQREVRYARKGE
jgi:CubicO group peptidase (beta-lactamase class C family)